MNQKEKIKKYRESIQVEASEEKIQETICKSKNAFFMAEQERMLSYHDFLWTQLRVIQKKMVGSSIYDFSGIMDCFKFHS